MSCVAAKSLEAVSANQVVKNVQRLSFLNAVTNINHNFEKNSPEKKPYLIKDNFAVKGMPLTCASAALENFISPYDATVVTRLRNAGYDVIGKTNLDEFAMGSGSVDSIFGPVKNPWSMLFSDEFDMTSGSDFYVAGGSSGGSAAAVAANLVPFAVGSDTGGSIRLPAALCGVLGFKPSYGVVSRHGLVSLANAFDTPGLFARDASLLESVFKVCLKYF